MDHRSRLDQHPHRQRSIAVIGAAFLVAACSAAAGSPNAGPSSIPGSAGPSVPPTVAPASLADAPNPSVISSPSPSVVPAPSMGALALLWQKGGPVTATKTSTWRPAIDPKTGEIWVSAGFEDRFWILSPDGEYVGSWGTPGHGAGQIELMDREQNPDPAGSITFAPDGSFYVGDSGDYRIEKFDADRHFVKAWGSFGTGDGQFGQIIGVATDGKTVYVADGDRLDIQAFDSNGTFLRSFGQDAGVAPGLALDKAGNIYTTNPQGTGIQGVLKFDPSGKEIGRYDMSFTGGITVLVAVDKDDNIFATVADPTTADQYLGTYELAPDGHLLRAWAQGGESIVVSPDGTVLYFALGNPEGKGWSYVRAYALPKS